MLVTWNPSIIHITILKLKCETPSHPQTLNRLYQEENSNCLLLFLSYFLSFYLQHTDNIEGTNPNITKPWQPPASSCTIKSNSMSFEDAFTGGENSSHRQNSSYKPTISNKNSNNPSIRSRTIGGNGDDNSNNNNSNNRNHGFDGSLGERTESNFMENNHLDDDSGSGGFDDLDDDNGRIRNKVSRSSSAARESMGLNGSQASMFAMTIAQTFIFHSIAYLFTTRVIS